MPSPLERIERFFVWCDEPTHQRFLPKGAFRWTDSPSATIAAAFLRHCPGAGLAGFFGRITAGSGYDATHRGTRDPAAPLLHVGLVFEDRYFDGSGWLGDNLHAAAHTVAKREGCIVFAVRPISVHDISAMPGLVWHDGYCETLSELLAIALSPGNAPVTSALVAHT